MSTTLRVFALSRLVLLLFLAAAVLAQGWLHRQHERVQAEAVETKRRQLAAAVEATAHRPDQWSPAHLATLGQLIDATFHPESAKPTAPARGKVHFSQNLPNPAGAPYVVEFILPQMARLSLLHGRTWGVLLVSSIAVMLLVVGIGVLPGRRTADTRTPWSNARAEINSLEQLARTSVAQGAELAQERDTRRRMERDLSLHQQLQNQGLEEKIRLGRDLHDGLIQSLYAVGLTIEAVRPLIRRDPDRADQRLHYKEISKSEYATLKATIEALPN